MRSRRRSCSTTSLSPAISPSARVGGGHGGRRASVPGAARVLSLVAERMVRTATFRANNYYGRLCETLGLEGREGPTKHRVTRSFRDYVRSLWRLLNDWIEAGEGLRGKPTAFAFDHRVHVGPPISQALVREADRRALLQMFLTYRFQPGDVISRADMARLLKDWLPTAPISNALRQLVARRGGSRPCRRRGVHRVAGLGRHSAGRRASYRSASSRSSLDRRSPA